MAGGAGVAGMTEPYAWRALEATLFSGDPLLFPAILLVLGLAAALAASMRRRVFEVRGRRYAIAAYVALAGIASLAAGGTLAQRAQLFWGLHVESGARVLVLDRLPPLTDIRIARADVTSVTEVTVPERSLAGPRPAAQFVVRTRSGAHYWSAPVYRSNDADRARALLASVSGGRLERFLVGSALP